MLEEEEAPLYHSSLKISIEGESPNEGGDVTLAVGVRGSVIGITATQGEEEQVVEMILSPADFLRFLTLAQSLLSTMTIEG